jgi:prevent-host-death family protein
MEPQGVRLMCAQRCSVAEAKKRLTRLIRELDAQGTVVITRRGEPVAVLLAYRRWAEAEQAEALRRLDEVRRRFAGGISAEQAWAEARRELEERHAGGRGD